MSRVPILALPLSLRTHLWLLILITLLPAFGLGLLRDMRARQEVTNWSREEALRVVQLLARDQERSLDGARQLVKLISSLPSVRSGDLGTRGGEGEREAAPQAGAGAGHEGDVPGQVVGDVRQCVLGHREGVAARRDRPTVVRSPAMRVGLLTREYPPEVYGGAGVHVDFLESAFAWIESEYGGVDRFLEDAAGLDRVKRRAVQDQLLER